MTEARIPNPLVEQFLKGGVPQELRQLAAQGALPLKTEDLLDLLHHLLGDPVPQVGKTAEATLRGLPTDDLVPVLKARDASAPVLAWALVNREDAKLREA